MRKLFTTSSYVASTCFLAAVTISSTGASAAVAIPDSARPEQVQKQFQLRDDTPTPTKAPLISMPDASTSKLKGNISFQLKEVSFEGLNNLSADTFKPIYEPYIGKKISLTDLNKIANSITAELRNKGYILSRAIVPPQKIETGNVKIRIIEGHIDNVRIEGNNYENRALIQQYASKIKAESPLRAQTLERYLLLMEDIPGVTSRAVLQPSATVAGASDLVIKIDRKWYEGQASFNDRGSKYLGPYQGSLSAGFNNIAGLDERTQFQVLDSIFQPNEIRFGEVRHEEILDSEGTVLDLGANYARTRPGSTLKFFDIDGLSRGFTAEVSHPIIRSRQNNWFVNGGFEFKNVDTDAFNTKLYQDKLRDFTIGSSYDFVDRFSAVNRIDGTLTRGTGILDTTSENGLRSRAGANPQFWKISANASHLQPISGPFDAYLTARGQYSADSLLAAEEMTLGGEEFGSAYDAAEISGDSGIAGRLELQYNQVTNWKILPQYQAYTFYDIGSVWNRDIMFNSEQKKLSLASAGIGTRFNVTDWLSGNMELAVPLTRKVQANNDNDARFFFGLQGRF